MKLRKWGDHPNPDDFVNTYSAPMLFYAIRDNLPHLIDAISSKGGDVNCHFNGHSTMLVHAVSKTRVQCVEALLRCGADPSTPARSYATLFADQEGVRLSCRRGQTALDVACTVRGVYTKRRDEAAVARISAIILLLGGVPCPEDDAWHAGVTCPICFAPQETEDESVTLPCTHKLCHFCAVRIQRRADGETRTLCPMCRADHRTDVKAAVSINKRQPLSINVTSTTMSELVALAFPRVQASRLPIHVEGGDVVLADAGVSHMGDVTVDTRVRVRNSTHSATFLTTT